MISRVKNHTITKHAVRIISFKLKLILFVLLPLVIFTLFTSRTELVPGIKSFVVLSGSMEPSIPVGSIVYSRSFESYQIGDVISYNTKNGQTVTHRIAEVTEDGFLTKGDANDGNDQEKVALNDVVGKVVFTVPFVGKVINFIRTPMGFVAVVIVPSFLFILSEMWTIKKEIEKEVEKRLLEKLQKS